MTVRIALAAALAAAIVGVPAAATQAPRGAYASLNTPDASACARACADDGICMAWSFHRENQCQLSAVVPASADPAALAAGFASRAPASLLSRTTMLSVEPLAPPAPPRQAATAVHSEEQPSLSAPADDGDVLLGGPLEGDLRLGLR